MHASLDEGRIWRSCEGGCHNLYEEIKMVSSLKPAGSSHGTEAFRKSFPGWGSPAETDFSRLYGKAQCALGSVIGGLNAFMEDKGKEIIPILERLADASDDRIITAGFVVAA